jgi:vitamin B12 transporter
VTTSTGDARGTGSAGIRLAASPFLKSQEEVFMQKQRALSGAIALCFVAHGAHAQQTSNTLSPVVITAHRDAQPANRVGQTVTVLDAQTLAQRQSATVVDALRSTPGISVARSGGIGSAASIFIRGAESDQTVVLIDGVKLNDPSSPGGGFNFGNLLIGNIDRIEVLRGAQSTLWGSQAIGGVINVRTRQPGEENAVYARAELGFRDTTQAVFNTTQRLGALSASLGVGSFKTDGISAFSEQRGGQERDGYDNTGANISVNYAVNDAISVDLRSWYSKGELNLDGFLPPNFSFGDANESSDTREQIHYGALNVAALDGRLQHRVALARTDTDRRSVSFDAGVSETFLGDGRNRRIEYQGSYAINTLWRSTFGLERENSSYSSSSFGAPATGGRARLQSVYAQAVGDVHSWLTITAGLRADDHDRFGGATSASASAVAALNDARTLLRASFSQGFKAPSLFQLQSDFGNRLLEPERSNGGDVGITQFSADGSASIGLTLFQRNSRDLIAFVSCASSQQGICQNRPFGVYDNVAKAQALGYELQAGWQANEALHVQANYTRLQSENRARGDLNFGNQLPRRPQRSGSLLVDYQNAFGFSMGATISDIGRSFDNVSNTRVLENYQLLDLRAATPIWQNLTLTLRLDNALDEEYETAFGFGQAGRAGYVGLRYGF